MHSYFKTIGFSLANHQEEEALIKQIIERAEKKNVYAENDICYAELSIEVSDHIGIALRGEYDKKDKFHVEHYFPYLIGQNVSTCEEVSISKRVDTEALTAMCDDYRMGVSMIFFLQNAVDYMKIKKIRGEEPLYHNIRLAGLALQGKVLLPIKKDKKMERIMSSDIAHRSELISEAKKGNREAIENLTLDDMDMYEMVSKRIQKEDIYSIVDTSFIPYGSESDNYSVLGIIQDVRLVQNCISKEELYVLSLQCNQMEFEVCINKNDLLGEPLPGRRFRGIVWMQGYVDFDS